VDLSGLRSIVDRGLDPVGHGNRPNVTALPDQVDNGPMLLALLEVGELQRDQFGPAQTASQEQRERSCVASAPLGLSIGSVQQILPFRRR
jgi:hypothetical protein